MNGHEGVHQFKEPPLTAEALAVQELISRLQVEYPEETQVYVSAFAAKNCAIEQMIKVFSRRDNVKALDTLYSKLATSIAAHHRASSQEKNLVLESALLELVPLYENRHVN